MKLRIRVNLRKRWMRVKNQIHVQEINARSTANEDPDREKVNNKIARNRDQVKLREYLVNKRRLFHQYPELGFQEYKTAQVIKLELESLGYEVKSGLAKTGLAATHYASEDDPVILLRFDMDALPITEENELDFVSKNPGVMHACGHDAHISIGLGVAREFMSLENKPPATLKLVFQPAEEGLGGAEAMIADGVLNNPAPDYTLAIHVWNEMDVGWAAITPGEFMAGADSFTIQIVGKGGHGALPQNVNDPILAAAQVIQSIQSIVSRNISPLDNGVVSVCGIHGGGTFNVIPQTVELTGTIRSFHSETRQKIIARLKDIAEGVALAFGCEARVEITEVTPPVINNASVAKIILSKTVAHFPELKINTQYRSLVSEDYSLFLNQIPGCFMFFGSGIKNESFRYGHHHPKFNIDEAVMPLAVSFLLQAIRDLSENFHLQ